MLTTWTLSRGKNCCSRIFRISRLSFFQLSAKFTCFVLTGSVFASCPRDRSHVAVLIFLLLLMSVLLVQPTRLRYKSNLTMRRGSLMLMLSTIERAVWVRALSRDIVLLYSHSTVSLSTQVVRWLPANLMLRITLRWASIPSKGKK